MSERGFYIKTGEKLYYLRIFFLQPNFSATLRNTLSFLTTDPVQMLLFNINKNKISYGLWS